MIPLVQTQPIETFLAESDPLLDQRDIEPHSLFARFGALTQGPHFFAATGNL